jgi:ABC-2 type transport system ATP-binding protein
MWAIEATGLTKAYGGRVVLEADLAIGEGETVAILGANGAGKTTLLRIVAGMVEPTDGACKVFGRAPGSLEARRLTAFVGESPALYGDLSLNEQIEFVARMHDVADWSERAEDLLDRLGLGMRGPDLPLYFSNGLRRKASLTLGLVRPAALLLLDDPFLAIDQAGVKSLQDLLVEERESGVTVVVATQHLEMLGQVDRCIELYEGQIVRDEPSD